MTLNVSDVVTLNNKFDNTRVDLYYKIFDFLLNTEGLDNSSEYVDYIRELADSKYHLETFFYNMALSEREKSYKYIDRTIYQLAYNSLDFKLFYKFLKLWYSSHRSLVTSLKTIKEPYYLSTDELDELIKSFGFPYPNKIVSRRFKISFLYNLIYYYKHKGTPYVFGESLKYFGLNDVVIMEWWLKKELNTDRLYFQSKPVYPEESFTNDDYIRKIYWNDFYEAFSDIHWYQRESDILSSYSTTNIRLPSITPYITIRSSFDVMRIRPGIAIIQEWIQETYEFFLKYVLNYTKNKTFDGTIVKGFINNTIGCVSGSTYIIGIYPIDLFRNYVGYYAKYDTVYGWKFGRPNTNEIIYNENTGTHWVYNGVTWINFGFEIPSTLLDQTKRGKLNRPVTLAGFSGSYSLWECMLIISYIWNSINDTTDERYVYYNGIYSPLDKEVDGVKDNIITDTGIYAKIYEEWDGYTDFSTPELFTRTNRDSKYAARRQAFQTEINKSGKEYVLHTLYDPELYLSILNPDLKEKLDDYISSSMINEIFGDILISLENYLIDYAKIIDIPFVFFLFNSYAYESYKKVIDFWKPYRVRIYSFENQIGIFDRLENSQLEEVKDYKKVVRYIGDQAPGRGSFYDSYTILDSIEIELRIAN